MSASCPSLTKGLDGAFIWARREFLLSTFYCCGAGVGSIVVPFSQVDAFSFSRKCIYVLNSRHVFCCCGYERGILLWRETLTLKCIRVKALLSFSLKVVAVLLPDDFWWSQRWYHQENGAAAMRLCIWFELYIYCRGNIIVCNLDSYRLYPLLFVYLGNNGKGR